MAKRISYEQKLNNFTKDVIAKLVKKATKSKKPSKHLCNTSAIEVPIAVGFNLDGGRYLDEITPTQLVDNSGYTYQFHVLTTEQLCEVLDALI
jgi:hypothetical protein